MKRAMWLCLGLVGVVLALSARQRARASCAPPQKCEVAEVVVLSCTPADPEKAPGVMRYVEQERKDKNAERAKRILSEYRGVYVEVQQKAAKQLDCKKGLDKKAYDESAFKLTGGGLQPSPAVLAGKHRYFAPTHDPAAACEKRFPKDRALRVRAAESCCDGDPGVPCLLSRE